MCARVWVAGLKTGFQKSLTYINLYTQLSMSKGRFSGTNIVYRLNVYIMSLPPAQIKFYSHPTQAIAHKAYIFTQSQTSF